MILNARIIWRVATENVLDMGSFTMAKKVTIKMLACMASTSRLSSFMAKSCPIFYVMGLLFLSQKAKRTPIYVQVQMISAPTSQPPQ